MYDELLWSISYLNSLISSSVLANLILIVDFIVEFACIVVAVLLTELYSQGVLAALTRALFFLEIPGLSARAGTGLTNGVILINITVAGLLAHNFLCLLGFFETTSDAFGGYFLSSFIICMGASAAYWAISVLHIARYRAAQISDVIIHGEAYLNILVFLLLPIEIISTASKAISTGLRLFANNLAGLIIEVLAEELIDATVIEGVRFILISVVGYPIKLTLGITYAALQVYTVGLLEVLSMLIQPCVLGAMAVATYKQSRDIL